MPTKVCTGCQRPKDESEFHWRSRAKGIRIARCKDCSNNWSKNHYKTNPDMYKRKARKWDKASREESTRRLLEYLGEHPCVDCGEGDPVVLTFDHVSGTKRCNVSKLVQKAGTPWAEVLSEISKCVVRCANCHMRKTSVQFGWKKKEFAVIAQLVEHRLGTAAT